MWLFTLSRVSKLQKPVQDVLQIVLHMSPTSSHIILVNFLELPNSVRYDSFLSSSSGS